ncbi:endonuclease domain-containing protein [Henriciella litoralis]|uniref:endonuclease domain-containing protein n=1 Tax=Henriciella litoralis TaxID=568102 RepID=UPI000A06789E|nr:endonuclease domain-containing protein [Henriciella litoralis]
MRKDAKIAQARRLRKSLTSAEVRLWARLRRRQIEGFRFRRQHPIGPYIADFACIEARLVVEVDGATHGSDEALARDARRSAWLEEEGWHVIRATNVEVYQNLAGVLDAVRNALLRG